MWSMDECWTCCQLVKRATVCNEYFSNILITFLQSILYLISLDIVWIEEMFLKIAMRGKIHGSVRNLIVRVVMSFDTLAGTHNENSSPPHIFIAFFFFFDVTCCVSFSFLLVREGDRKRKYKPQLGDVGNQSLQLLFCIIF